MLLSGSIFSDLNENFICGSGFLFMAVHSEALELPLFFRDKKREEKGANVFAGGSSAPFVRVTDPCRGDRQEWLSPASAELGFGFSFTSTRPCRIVCLNGELLPKTVRLRFMFGHSDLRQTAATSSPQQCGLQGGTEDGKVVTLAWLMSLVGLN